MNKVPATGGGLLEALRLLADSLLAGLQDRIALAAIEFEEEAHRKCLCLLWVCALVLSGAMAILFGSFALVYLFWESARLQVLFGLSGAYLLAFVVIGLSFRRFLARQPHAFAATLASLEEDRRCILREK